MAPDMSSFLWKMLLDLLSTQQRLHRMGASPSPLCKLCSQETGTLRHELIDCTHNGNNGQLLLTCLQTHIPNLTAENLPLAAGINEGGRYFRYFGLSGVGALPLAAGINEGGHYFR